MKRRLGSIVLLFSSLLLCLVIAEVASRFLLPISPGAQVLDLGGEPVTIDGERLRLPRSLQYREVSQEFDVRVTLTDKGHRVPAIQGNPQIVFLGDSFTFGSGLNDEQTFVTRFCEGARIQCANLGRGGTGTRWQLDILEDFLEHENWRPLELKLFMLVMTSALMSGNDLLDNIREAEAVDYTQVPTEEYSWVSRLLSYRVHLLRRSNLARVCYFYFGPQLRTLLSPAPRQTQLDTALEKTTQQLQRLSQLAIRYGFEYRLYLLYPMQDLLGGTHRKTMQSMRKIAPNIEIVDTADVLRDAPSSYYYPYDGHLNPQGARQIAELLLREHGVL